MSFNFILGLIWGCVFGVLLFFGILIIACKFKAIRKFLGSIGVPRYAPVLLKNDQMLVDSASNPHADYSGCTCIYKGFYVSENLYGEFHAKVLVSNDQEIYLIQYTNKLYTYWDEVEEKWYRGRKLISSKIFDTLQDLKDWLEYRSKDMNIYKNCWLAGDNASAIMKRFESIERQYERVQQ